MHVLAYKLILINSENASHTFSNQWKGSSLSWSYGIDTTLCDKVCQWLETGRWFSPGILVSSTNKNRLPRYNWNIV